MPCRLRGEKSPYNSNSMLFPENSAAENKGIFMLQVRKLNLCMSSVQAKLLISCTLINR